MVTMTIPNLDDVDDRDVQLRIRGHLSEISEWDNEVIRNGQGFPSARQGYQYTLSATAICADVDAVDEVADYIKSQYQGEFPERPANRKVRRNAKRIVRDNGYEPHDFLNV